MNTATTVEPVNVPKADPHDLAKWQGHTRKLLERLLTGHPVRMSWVHSFSMAPTARMSNARRWVETHLENPAKDPQQARWTVGLVLTVRRSHLPEGDQRHRLGQPSDILDTLYQIVPAPQEPPPC